MWHRLRPGPLIMGILNVTPDSFSDGGEHFVAEAAVAHAHRMINDGADVIDIGGESTRPGAAPVDAQEQIRRVVPVIAALKPGLPEHVVISADTRVPEVANACLAAGATVVNDISGARAPGMLECIATHNAGVVLMHMQGTPQTMQDAPSYEDVVGEVRAYLLERARKRHSTPGSRRRALPWIRASALANPARTT